MLFASVSSGAQLTCHPTRFTCLDSPVSCKCQGETTITWEVRLTSDSEPLFSHIFTATGMNEGSSNGFTAVRCNVTEDPRPGLGVIIVRLTSKLTFMFMENVTVECEADNSQHDPATALLQRASKPAYIHSSSIAINGLSEGSCFAHLLVMV